MAQGRTPRGLIGMGSSWGGTAPFLWAEKVLPVKAPGGPCPLRTPHYGPPAPIG